MTDNPDAKPLTPYRQRHRQLTAAVKAWMEDPRLEQDADAGKAAQALVGFLDEAGLQVLPRATTYADYRVVVDGQPAPSLHAPGWSSGPMDADEAAEAFLLAAQRADQDHTNAKIEVRPASDQELVARLVGDTTLRPDPVTVQVNQWGLLQRGDNPVLVFTGPAGGTVVEAVFDEGEFVNFTGAMAQEAG